MMKKTLLIIFTLLAFKVFAFDYDEADRIKGSRLILGLSEYEEENEFLRSAIKDLWTVNKIKEEMPIDEALKLAKEDKSVLVMRINSVRSKSTKHGTDDYQWRTISEGWTLEIVDKKSKVIWLSYLLYYGDNYLGKECIYNAVGSMNYNISVFYDNKVTSVFKVKKYYEKNTSGIKDKKLVICKDWLESGLDEKAISEIYPGKVDVVDYKVWSGIITEKKEGYAYSIVVPQPIAGDYNYTHYLVDAKTGMFYAYPNASVKIKGKDKGYIKEKNIERYADAYNGDW